MKQSICKINADMKTVLAAINEAPAGIAFITDEHEKLCGVVTDGDFRRLLLKGKSLETLLTVNDLSEFVYAKQGERIEELIKKSNKKVRIIPIIDNDFRLVDYFRYEHRVQMMPVAEPDLKGNEFKYLTDAFLSTWISSRGEYIDRFEESFASYCGVNHGVAVSNGTVSLHLALKALDIGEGDEVIVPNLTFAATANAVLHAHATPVLVDIEKDSWCISPQEIEKAITAKTKAIIPVHIYGQPCNMEQLIAIAKRHNLYIIEDCAEAHGAEYAGKKVGSMGHISCFSFFANKIITTGEGGMCLTNSDALNARLRKLRDHGMSSARKYWHDEVGFNYRMTNLQAAVGCAQLERIEEILLQREEIEFKYKNMLSEFDYLSWQREDLENRKKVTWLVSLLVEGIDREEILHQFNKYGIDTRPFFYPLSTMPIYQKYTFSQANSLEIASKGFNLPTIQQVDYEKVYHSLKMLYEKV